MKKVFLFFFCLLALAQAGCVAADPYAIDEKATVSAPWQVGEITAKGSIFLEMNHDIHPYSVYRKFLGITKDGAYYLVQEFYSDTDKPYTSPYRLIHAQHVDQPFYRENASFFPLHFSPYTSRSGAYTIWYPNGDKAAEINYWGGWPKGGIILWHDNGNKKYQTFPASKNSDAFYFRWDEQGQLIDSGKGSLYY